jgi:hypothetical protein
MEVREREDLLRDGEAAIAAADWDTARASLERVLEQRESPEALRTAGAQQARFLRHHCSLERRSRFVRHQPGPRCDLEVSEISD